MLKAVKGDITKITDVEAIVNAANESLSIRRASEEAAV